MGGLAIMSAAFFVFLTHFSRVCDSAKEGLNSPLWCEEAGLVLHLRPEMEHLRLVARAKDFFGDGEMGAESLEVLKLAEVSLVSYHFLLFFVFQKVFYLETLNASARCRKCHERGREGSRFLVFCCAGGGRRGAESAVDAQWHEPIRDDDSHLISSGLRFWVGARPAEVGWYVTGVSHALQCETQTKTLESTWNKHPEGRIS